MLIAQGLQGLGPLGLRLFNLASIRLVIIADIRNIAVLEDYPICLIL